MTPEFHQAAEELRRHVESGTSQTPDGMRAFQRFLQLAPPELREQIEAMAREDGLIPKPSGYMNDEPVFSVDDVAEHLGMPANEVRAGMEALAREAPGGAVVYVDPAGVARIN
jgi:hypothetical protein